MTAFASLVDAVVAALQAAPAVAAGKVFAHRLRPIAASDAAAVVVRLEQTSATAPIIHANDWQTVLAVECYGKTVGVTQADAAVDALLPAVWPRLQGLSASALAVAQVAVDPQIEWLRDLDATAEVCALVRLTIWHRTPSNSLEPWQ